MRNIVEDRKELPTTSNTIYDYKEGYFGRETARDGQPYLHWHTCREVFHQYADEKSADHPPISTYAFCFTNTIEDIAEFIVGIEDILFDPLLETGRTKFRRCKWSKCADLKNIMWVELHPWWKQQNMRHQFFTCCMRAAMYYKRDTGDFYQTLFKQPYFKYTHNAVLRFLDGYTWYTGAVVGWNNAFSALQKNDDMLGINGALIRPPIVGPS